MSNDKEKQPLGSDDTLDNVNGIDENAAPAEDEMSEAKENLRKALEEVQEANEAEKAEKKSGKKEKKPKHERTPEEESERALNSVSRKKRLKYGSVATLITLVFIAIIAVVNVIVNMLDKRFNLNIDLTSSGLYEIDEKTIDYLHQVKDDIKITVLADENYFMENAQLKVVSETLNRFRTESNNHISVEYVDLNKNPEAVRKYSANYSGEFSLGDIVVAKDTDNLDDKLVRVLKFQQDVIKTEQSIDYTTYSYVYNYSFIGEQSLVSALMGVTDLNPVKVALINKVNGSPIYAQYEQYSYQRLSELLKKNNYEVEEVDLVTDPLDDQYALAILCAPYDDLTKQMVDKLADYMKNDNKYGKKMVYFSSPNQKETPMLDEFLETWGLKFGAAVVYEGNSAAAQYVNIAVSGGSPLTSVPVLSVTDDPLNSGMVASKTPIVAPLARPIELLFESNSGRTTDALLKTSDTCFLFPLNADADSFDPDKAERGSYVLTAMADTTFSDDSGAHTSTMVAFGSAWFLDYYVAGSRSYNNADYFVSLMNSMTGKENVITIAEKSLDQTSMDITAEKVSLIRTITMFMIPLAVAVVGIVVYVRRKNR